MGFNGRREKSLQFNEMMNHLREFADLTEEEFVLSIAVAASSAETVWPELWAEYNDILSREIPAPGHNV